MIAQVDFVGGGTVLLYIAIASLILVSIYQVIRLVYRYRKNTRIEREQAEAGKAWKPEGDRSKDRDRKQWVMLIIAGILAAVIFNGTTQPARAGEEDQDLRGPEIEGFEFGLDPADRKKGTPEELAKYDELEAERVALEARYDAAAATAERVEVAEDAMGIPESDAESAESDRLFEEGQAAEEEMFKLEEEAIPVLEGMAEIESELDFRDFGDELGKDVNDSLKKKQKEMQQERSEADPSYEAEPPKDIKDDGQVGSGGNRDEGSFLRPLLYIFGSIAILLLIVKVAFTAGGNALRNLIFGRWR